MCRVKKTSQHHNAFFVFLEKVTTTNIYKYGPNFFNEMFMVSHETLKTPFFCTFIFEAKNSQNSNTAREREICILVFVVMGQNASSSRTNTTTTTTHDTNKKQQQQQRSSKTSSREKNHFHHHHRATTTTTTTDDNEFIEVFVSTSNNGIESKDDASKKLSSSSSAFVDDDDDDETRARLVLLKRLNELRESAPSTASVVVGNDDDGRRDGGAKAARKGCTKSNSSWQKVFDLLDAYERLKTKLNDEEDENDARCFERREFTTKLQEVTKTIRRRAAASNTPHSDDDMPSPSRGDDEDEDEDDTETETETGARRRAGGVRSADSREREGVGGDASARGCK